MDRRLHLRQLILCFCLTNHLVNYGCVLSTAYETSVCCIHFSVFFVFLYLPRLHFLIRSRSYLLVQDGLSGDALAWAILAGGAIAAATTVVNKRRKARVPVTPVDASQASASLTYTSAAAPAPPPTNSHVPTHPRASSAHSHAPDYSDSHFSAISVMHDGPCVSFAHGPSGPLPGSGGSSGSHLPPHLLAKPSASWSAPHHTLLGNRRGHKSRDKERDKDRRRSKGTVVSAAASPSRPLQGED